MPCSAELPGPGSACWAYIAVTLPAGEQEMPVHVHSSDWSQPRRSLAVLKSTQLSISCFWATRMFPARDLFNITYVPL